MLNIKEGDNVFFLKDGSFYAKWISFFTSSSFTHVGIVYEIKQNSVIIAEALSPGVVLVERDIEMIEDMYFKKQIDFLRPKGKISKVKNSIDKYVGIPYGFLDIFNIVWAKLFGKYLFKTDKTQVICSELNARVDYEISNYKIDISKEFNKNWDLITPDDLFRSKQLVRFDVIVDE